MSKTRQTDETTIDLENIAVSSVEPYVEERKVLIKLPRIQGKKDDMQQVVVSINNRRTLIKRGVEIEVPYETYLQLKHSENAEEVADAYISQASEKSSNE